MRNKNVLYYYIYIVAAMVLAACSDEAVPSIGSSSQNPILLSAGYQTLTRVTELGFDNGDEMGVYVVDYVDGQPASLDGGQLHGDNVRYTYSLSSNAWTGATTLYWHSMTNPVDFYGYYPFDAEMSHPTAYSFMVSSRQDSAPSPGHKGGYEASDLLWAKAGNVAPTSETIQMLYHHLMAGITIRLQEGEGFSEGEWTEAEKMAWVYNTVVSATVNLEDGTVSPVGDDVVRITPLEYNGDYRAVVVPQTVGDGKTLIGLTIDGQNYSLAKPVPFTYTSGKMHTFTIEVNKRKDTGDYEFSLIDESIAAWLDDAEFHDGVVTEYVSVHVDKPGTLGKVMEKMELDMARIECLKVSGTVDWDDFGFIRENQKILTKLNLYDVVIDDEDDELDDAVGNIGGHRWGWSENPCNMLRYVFLPKRLKKIADYAFAGCPLIGSFIFPEGLEYIGTASMTARGTNGMHPGLPAGELYLPTTLKHIGDESFHSCIFTGELHLPEGLEYLGSNAFDHSYFTGPLRLPPSLKHIGGSVFTGCHFSGDLVIPQGIKELVWCFEGTKFDGSLIIPEGVEVIHRAFGGSGFKGELKLPSTLKETDWCFNGNNFTRIIWPDNLQTLGVNTFADCNRLTGTITIPRGICALDDNVFGGCSSITGIELHKDVSYIGYRSFANCHHLTSIVCHAEEPPVFEDNSFEGVAVANVTVEVPEGSVARYQNDDQWKKFKRITAYRNFVTRPQSLCALNTAHEHTITINAEGDWTVTHKPDWCRLSATSGSKKSQLRCVFDEMERGIGNREDYIEFTLDGTSYTTRCALRQYDYEHAEDEVVVLQKHTKGGGIKIAMLGDGWDAEQIASGAYLEQCRRDMEHFFGLPPYDRLREYFDVVAPVALSQESGVNTLYTVLDTRFGTIYSAGVLGAYESKLIPDEDPIFDYLTDESGAFSNYDETRCGLVILIPNTTDYSGITYYCDRGTISICPPLAGAYPNDERGTVQHEACGHGFGKLGDEKISLTAFATSAAKSEISDAHSRGWYQNLSTTGRMSDVPWAHLIFNPQYSDYVDVFEGGYGYTRSIWRSEANSCMNYGIPYFNAISRQDITRRVKETAGERFDLDEFYAADTKSWGVSSLSSGTRAAAPGIVVGLQPVASPSPVFVCGGELRARLRELRRQQYENSKR